MVFTGAYFVSSLSLSLPLVLGIKPRVFALSYICAFLIFNFLNFETGSVSGEIPQAGLKLATLLLQPLKFWDCIHAPLHLPFY